MYPLCESNVKVPQLISSASKSFESISFGYGMIGFMALFMCLFTNILIAEYHK
ncbi:hypothetical protein [Methylomonas albis]|nr:hypothetical protein [Methylomonas albis]